jgi:hypothetical protein
VVPFSNTSVYLQSFLLAELHFLSHHRSVALSEIDGEEEAAVLRLEQGERVLQKALALCSVYTGNIQIYGQEAAALK